MKMANQGYLEHLEKKEKIEKMVQVTTNSMVQIVISACNTTELNVLETIRKYAELRISELMKQIESGSDEIPIARYNMYNFSFNYAPTLTAREQSWISVGQPVPHAFATPNPTESLQKRCPETRNSDLLREFKDATSKISTDDFVQASFKDKIRKSFKKADAVLDKIKVNEQDHDSEDNESVIQCIQQSMSDSVYHQLDKASAFCKDVCSKYDPLKFLKDFPSKFGNLASYIQVGNNDDLEYLKLCCPSASDIWRYYTSSNVPYDHYTVLTRFNELSKRIKSSFNHKVELTMPEPLKDRKPSASFKGVLAKLGTASTKFPAKLKYVDGKETFFRAKLVGTPDYLGVTSVAGKIAMAIEFKDFEGKSINRTSIRNAIKQSMAYAYILKLPKAYLVVKHNQNYKLYVTDMDTETAAKFAEEVTIAFRNMTVFWLTYAALLKHKPSQLQTKL